MILNPLKFNRLLQVLNPNKAWILKVVFFCPPRTPSPLQVSRITNLYKIIKQPI